MLLYVDVNIDLVFCIFWVWLFIVFLISDFYYFIIITLNIHDDREVDAMIAPSLSATFRVLLQIPP